MLRKTALGLGIGLSTIGSAGIAIYVAGAVDVLVNQPPDRSWLFWGLAVAGPAVGSLAGGVALLVLWWNLRRKDAREPLEDQV